VAAYYNEFDPKAAAWLRELIRCGHIAPGEVDERSIIEVQPDDLRGFTQCHFFAGIGVWSYAFRQAGWSDDRPVWSGSCPCQPFSAAGKGDEFGDERHLWPAWFRLIRECRPVAVFGEQVASKDALSWLDHVSTDLEGEGYSVGAVDTCAAGFGAPHIRQRLYFVADAQDADRRRGERGEETGTRPDGERGRGFAGDGATGDMGNASGRGLGIERDAAQPGSGGHADGAEQSSGMGIANGLQPEQSEGQRARPGETEGGRPCSEPTRPSATNGFWADAEWIACRDGKSRPTEPGTFPLVTGAPARVVRLRGYGNSIVAPQAQAFIESYLEVSA